MKPLREVDNAVVERLLYRFGDDGYQCGGACQLPREARRQCDQQSVVVTAGGAVFGGESREVAHVLGEDGAAMTDQPYLALAELTSWRETATALAAGLGKDKPDWLDADDDTVVERP